MKCKRQGFRLFKTTYRDRRGRWRKATRWYVEFRDHLSTVRRLPAFTSRAASDELGRNLVKLVAYHKGTGGQVDPALTGWLGGLPQKTRNKLAEIGLLSAERVGAGKLLADHITNWHASLIAKGTSREQADIVTARTPHYRRVWIQTLRRHQRRQGGGSLGRYEGRRVG
jgi:hypothetical protein